MRVLLPLSIIFILFSFTSDVPKLDLFLLIGQSNMAGRGEITSDYKYTNKHIFMLDKDNNWVQAQHPLHFDKKAAGVGPGLEFAKVLLEQNSSRRIGIIPCAQGGSSISTWFTGELHNQTKKYPYDYAIERTKVALKQGELKGILWHQGESDRKAEKAIKYKERWIAMMNNFKQDLEIDDVPIVLGEISWFKPQASPYNRIINEQIREIAREYPNTALVIEKGLSCKSDYVHYDSKSATELGRRYAQAFLNLEDNGRK